MEKCLNLRDLSRRAVGGQRRIRLEQSLLALQGLLVEPVHQQSFPFLCLRSSRV